MADIAETIARVLELDAEATKGPWKPSVGVYHDMEGDSEADDCFFGRGPVPFPHARALGEADAELIAYYRTAAPLLADEVERLRAENAARREELRLAQCPNPRDPEHGGHCETCSGLSVARTRRLSELESEVERLLAREAELEEALRPFAACSVGLDDPDAEGDIDWAEESLTLADVRTARAALAKGDR